MKAIMAQKFITKRNRHIFRRPIKSKVDEKIVLEIPAIIEEVEINKESIEVSTIVESPVVEAEVILQEVEETSISKKSSKKNRKEIIEEETFEE